MKSNLEKCERETIIRYDESSGLATIYSSSRKYITKCKKAGYKILQEDEFGVLFETKKNNICFRAERKNNTKRVISEEQIRKMQEGRKKKS